MSTEITQKSITAAYEYLRTTLATAGVRADQISNVRVEEAEVNEKGNYKITLSYEVVGQFAFERQREFKDFEVDPKTTPTPTVVSMKIRKI